MPDYKDILRRGWHPEKEGTTLKGQMKSLVGRGDDDRREGHVARPLSSLRDPSSFAPPPKRNSNAVIGAASSTTSASPASQAGPTAPPEPEADEPPPPPKPWRLDTTGLSTAHLPPPPGRKDGADGRSPAQHSPVPPPAAGGRPGPPALPPRLPPRSASASPITPSPTAAAPALPSRPSLARIPTPSSASPGPVPVPGPKPKPAPPPQPALLNQSAINRLGAAGISVPGLGIGESTRSPLPPIPPARFSPVATGPTSPPAAGSQQNPQLSELQSRFAKLGPSSPIPAAGENIRPLQHVRGFSSGSTGSNSSVQGGTASLVAEAAKKKKPPPPPPKKKPGLGSFGNAAGMGQEGQQGKDDEPPPIPLATRPRF